MAQKPVYSNQIMASYIDNTNVNGQKVYITYQCKNNISPLGYRYGSCICGKKIPSVKGARFYVFGGKDDTGTFKNDLVTFDVTYWGGGPLIQTVTSIVPDGSTFPSGRIFASLKIISDGILLYGGMDSNCNALSDLQKYTFATNSQSELSVSGDIPAPRILCGEM